MLRFGRSTGSVGECEGVCGICGAAVKLEEIAENRRAELGTLKGLLHAYLLKGPYFIENRHTGLSTNLHHDCSVS